MSAASRSFKGALGAVIAATVVACGGGEDEEPVAVSRPQTKVEFLREADRICEFGDTRIEAAADDLLSANREPDPAEVRRLALRVVVPALESEVRAIAALPVPEGDEDEVGAILAATERGIAQIEAAPERLIDGPPPGLREAGRLAQRYGSQQCGVR